MMISKSATRRQSRKRVLFAAAVLSAAGGAASNAFAQNVYWDLDGTTPGSGATGGVVSGTWNATNTFWNTNSGGGAGTLSAEVGAANTGVFSAAADATGASTITIPNGVTHDVGGIAVEEGTVAFFGNNTADANASVLNFPNPNSTINVAAGATLHSSSDAHQTVFTGSGTITKTGPGYFNNFSLNSAAATPRFNGKWSVSEGTMGVFFGNSNGMLGQPATFTSDQLTISNNAVIKTLQNFNSVSFQGNQGVKIGAGGATFFFAGGNDFNPSLNYTSLGSIQFTTRITGGSEAARVPITIMSNTLPGASGIGQTTGATVFNFQDNSSSATAPPLFAKWIVKSGELGLARAGTTADTALGAVPSTFLPDAITLDGGYLRPNANCILPVNRGITLGAAGGGLHPVLGAGQTASTFTVNSVISGGAGSGPLKVFLENNAAAKVVLAGANTYTGGTIVTVVAGASPNGTLQVDTTSLPGNVTNDVNLAFDQTFTGTFPGIISGIGKLLKTNTGIVYLTGNNTYTGQTAPSGGALVANSTASLPGYGSGQISPFNGGIIAASAGGAGQWSTADIDTLISGANYNNGTGLAGINVDTGNTFTYPTNIGISGGFGKVGGGELTLTGNNTYAGGTAILGGILSVSSTSNLGSLTNSVTFGNGGTLKLLSGFNPDNGIGGRTIILGAGGGVLDTNGFTIPDMQTPFTGPGSFTKAGGGTVVSGQNNTYAGGTFLKGGNYEIINDANLGASGTPITFDGGTLTYRQDFSTGRAINLAAGGGTLNTNTHALDASSSAIEGTGSFSIVGGGSIKTSHIRTTGNLTLNNATLILAPNGLAPGVSKVGALSVASKIDLGNNHLITTSAVGVATAGTYNGVSRLIQTGRNGGGWTGNGIVTSQSDATSGNFTSIGIATAAQVKSIAATATAAWAGQTVTGSDSLVMYTYGGDANLDGKINVDDYGRIDFNVPLGVAGWYNGDFNYDGTINVDDYGIIDFNVGIQGAAFFAAGGVEGSGAGLTAVPEPATVGLLGLGAMGWLSRRRRGR